MAFRNMPHPSDLSPKELGSSSGLRPIVFLGGIFTPQQTDFIHRGSKGIIQNAADALQKNLIKGLSVHTDQLTVLNLPFVGPYPSLFCKPLFPSTRETIAGKVPVQGKGFVVVRFLRPFSRFLSALRGLVQIRSHGNSLVLIYSAHLPFLLAALFHRFFRADKICLILPDFPEFMDERGFLYTTLKSIQSRIFYLLARRVDGFVLLTHFMAERLNLPSERYVVVEGIAEPPAEIPGASTQLPRTERRIFLYTGTLAARYGIVDLVQAFRDVRTAGAELWICGEGDSRDKILQAVSQDPRIRYLGQVSRPEALRLQERASVLVNPRRPVGEFTKYSFPSKTLEYMASGRPVLMHALPGIPSEYLPYFFRPPSPDLAGLTIAMQELAECDISKLQSMGAAAKDFVLARKNAVSQCRKIMNLIASL